MSGFDVRNGNDPDVVPLTPQQRRTARIIASELRRTPGATARVQKAAYAAPLVEANLENPNYGDADSLGAFQERTSIYGRSHALNVGASARRFITDAVRLNSQGFKGSAGALAQAVQRSAFPDRYDKRGADALVRQFVGGKAPAGGGQAGAQILQGGGDPGTVPQGSEGILSLVEQLTAKPQQPQSAGLAAPAVSAAPAMPQGARLVQAGGGPSPKPDIAALLEAVRTVGGDVPGGASGGQETVLPGAAGAGQGNGQAGGAAASGGRVTVAPGANRSGVPLHKDVIGFVKEVSAITGRPLRIGTGTAHDRLTVNGTESDHWRGEGADVPLSGRALVRAGQAALIAAGMPAGKAHRITGGGFNVGGWQVIFNTDAPGWGNHTDHLHVGRRR